MSLLDTLMKTATGALASGSAGTTPGILDAIGALVQDHGGLGGLVGKLRDAGLGREVDSWISTGQNLPVSAQDLLSALGQGPLADLARQAGIDPQQLAGHLADVLPKTIDQLTPNGRLPN